MLPIVYLGFIPRIIQRCSCSHSIWRYVASSLFWSCFNKKDCCAPRTLHSKGRYSSWLGNDKDILSVM